MTAAASSTRRREGLRRESRPINNRPKHRPGDDEEDAGLTDSSLYLHLLGPYLSMDDDQSALSIDTTHCPPRQPSSSSSSSSCKPCTSSCPGPWVALSTRSASS